ncbi:MBL fold metallo-hydrolase [Hoyosella subflava]|uniref:Beta-lactamase domain protein n=1 Tax=Hoyosella subflava (strain DSM 45089 / JCM 17490 / NBRC 109087 / DQS3-9A1) TaxID=443218 RepID=F6EEQ2_HOYSD|nr:hypothetical protein [Hoyosella subflava]AEF40852.1 Beta-lactamase domain protein [Hoyosella subflava DQS3-9A1]
MVSDEMSWVCVTCANEYLPAGTPPELCIICTDDRQYVPSGGQQWVRLDDDAHTRRQLTSRVVEDGLSELTFTPTVGVGQRTFVVETESGNVLWEPPGFAGPVLVDWLLQHGGISAIASSHPHLVGASVALSHQLGHVPIWFNASDRRWVTRPDPVIKYWSARQRVLPGVELVQCGGHFPGSSLLLIERAAEGRGAVLSGDTIMVGADRASVSFMRSFPNLIPLPPRLVEQIADTAGHLEFDRLYSAFGDACIMSGAREVIRASADRYIGWITDQIVDPDDHTL